MTLRFLRVAAACSLLTGIALVFVQLGTSQRITAQLSSQGATLGETSDAIGGVIAWEMIEAQYAEVGQEIGMGVLFVLVGFLLHALWAQQRDRSVRITAVAPKPKAAQKEFFWMQIRV